MEEVIRYRQVSSKKRQVVVESGKAGQWGWRLEWNSLGIQVSQKSHPQSETVGGVTICCPSWMIRKFRTGVEGRESHAQG